MNARNVFQQPIEVGELRHRVQLLRQVDDTAADGQQVEEFVLHAEVWAAAQPLRGMQWLTASAQQSGATVKFTIRHRRDIAAGWRLRWQSRDYEVNGDPIDVHGRGQFLELMCRART